MTTPATPVVRLYCVQKAWKLLYLICVKLVIHGQQALTIFPFLLYGVVALFVDYLYS